MIRRALGVLMLGSCVMSSGVAVAQERAPHTGSTAVGMDVGAFIPAADQLDNALIVSALLDYYVTPRVSLRTGFGLTDPGFVVIGPFAPADPAAIGRQLQLGRRQVASLRGGRCRGVLSEAQTRRPGVRRHRNHAWVQHRRRHRVFHWPDRLAQGRSPLSRDRQHQDRNGSLGAGVDGWTEEVLVMSKQRTSCQQACIDPVYRCSNICSACTIARSSGCAASPDTHARWSRATTSRSLTSV